MRASCGLVGGRRVGGLQKAQVECGSQSKVLELFEMETEKYELRSGECVWVGWGKPVGGL